jgi:hypothetical protein
MAQIQRTEGGGGHKGLGYECVEIEAKGYDGKTYKCQTLVENPRKRYHPQFYPSSRYMELLEVGAAENNLDSSYQNWLKTLPRYVAVPTIRHKIGKWLFMGTSLMVGFPILALLLIYRVLLNSIAPRIVHVALSYLMFFVGVYYFYLFRPLFGNGAGELDGPPPNPNPKND